MLMSMQTQVLEDVCDASCQQRNVNRLQIRCSAPPAAVVTDNNGDEVLPYSTEITPTLIACYKAAAGGMGLISKTVVLPRN